MDGPAQEGTVTLNSSNLSAMFMTMPLPLPFAVPSHRGFLRRVAVPFNFVLQVKLHRLMRLPLFNNWSRSIETRPRRHRQLTPPTPSMCKRVMIESRRVSTQSLWPMG